MFSSAYPSPVALNGRLDQLGEHPFTKLAGLLKGPPGAEPIQMSIGEPQHPAPAMVAEILAREAAGWSKYPPVAGTPGFRAAAAGWLKRRYALADGLLDPDAHILPLAGTREGLYLIAQVCVGERRDGKRPAVLLPNPFYHVYVGAAVLGGGEPIYVPGGATQSAFLPDFAQLPEETLARTAFAFLCTPANPQGAVASLDQLAGALALARQYGFVLAVDECYSEIYDRVPPSGALQAAAALGGGLDNLVVFHSLSKRSSVPGLRVGFIAGDGRVIAAFSRLRSYGGASVPVPMLAAAEALWADETHVEANRALYRAKFDLAQRMIGNRFGFYRPAGGFYLWLDVGNGEAAAETLWREAGVRTLPGGYMGRVGADGINPGAPYIRAALIHDLATTERALGRIAETLQ